MLIKALHDADRNKTWIVRLVEQGDHYGRNSCILHDKPEPMVEFYDPAAQHTGDLGYFVSRYYRSTLLESTSGLLLDTASPNWQVQDAAMAELRNWLRTET